MDLTAPVPATTMVGVWRIDPSNHYALQGLMDEPDRGGGGEAGTAQLVATWVGLNFVRIATAAIPLVIALIVAGCDGDEDGTTTEAPLSPKQEVEQIAETWAPLFAAAPHPGACGEFDEQDPQREVAARYMAQPACEWLACERVATGPIKNCTPVSLASQESFADAAVEDVATEGGRAAAKFSNGVAVEFVHDPVQQPEDELAPRWLIVKVGGNAAAEFFD